MRITDEVKKALKNYETHPEFLGEALVSADQRGSMDNAPIHIAASRGAVDDVVLFISNGADVNMAGDLGNTPLHQAAMMGKSEVVKVLLKLGANRNSLNEFGESPLTVAKQAGADEIVRLLV